MPTWEFNNILECKINSVSGGDATFWHADVYLKNRMVTQDDLIVLRPYLPFCDNIIITPSESKIRPVQSIDLLFAICHHLSIYVSELIHFIGFYKGLPLYWDDDKIDLWLKSCQSRIESEGA